MDAPCDCCLSQDHRMTTGAAEDPLTKFRAWYLCQGRAAGSVYGRYRYLARLASEHDLATVTADQLLTWLASHDWAPETRKSAREALILFYGWGVKHGLREDNPMAEIAPTRIPPPCPRPVPDSVLARARMAASPDEMLMIDLGCFAGLRASEIASLHSRCLEDDYLRIEGKGQRTRIIPIPPELACRIAERPSGWTFPGRFPGTHLTAGVVVRRLSALLGDYTAHSLRHRYASRCYDATGDLLALQELLGHSSPSTTRRYVRVTMTRLRATALAAS